MAFRGKVSVVLGAGPRVAAVAPESLGYSVVLVTREESRAGAAGVSDGCKEVSGAGSLAPWA